MNGLVFQPPIGAPRAPGGRAAIGDLDGDGAGEIVFTEQTRGGPVTSIYELTSSQPPSALAWRPVLHPLGNEVRWDAPASGARVFDLALYRSPNSAARVTPCVSSSRTQRSASVNTLPGVSHPSSSQIDTAS